jgi:ethanolamine utilization protein EutN
MKFARVIGRVTLAVADPTYRGGRLLVAMPCRPDTPVLDKAPLPKGNSLVVYDNLGAGAGDLIAYTDGGEASAPFVEDTPCDAFCSAIIDTVFHDPILSRKA